MRHARGVTQQVAPHTSSVVPSTHGQGGAGRNAVAALSKGIVIFMQIHLAFVCTLNVKRVHISVSSCNIKTGKMIPKNCKTVQEDTTKLKETTYPTWAHCKHPS